MKAKGKKYLPQNCDIDIKSIIKKSQEYFFLAKNAGIEKRREVFKDYHALVKRNLMPFIKFSEEMSIQAKSHLPWNHKKAIEEIGSMGRRYLLDVAHFIRTHRIKSGKILSFNLSDVICINKGKPGKEREFGRRFQVGRLKGNFLAVYTCTSLEMNDKLELQNLLREHEEIFGKEVIETVTTDKGYYSQDNIKYTEENIGSTIGLQRPTKVKEQVVDHRKEELHNRRSGVEPIIGHAKKFGLGKSRMKSDKATLASGYRSVFGFNLHQLTRNLKNSKNIKVKQI
jgi:hypothetical protein